jgi:uncharacterized membrane protein YbhN (UPF0104 family)
MKSLDRAMNKFKSILKYLVSISILIYLFFYTFKNRELFSLDRLSLIFGVFTCMGLFYLFLSFPFFNILRKRISLSSLYLLNILTSFMNLILPMRGGVLYRAYSLKKENNIGVREYAAISVLLSMSSFFILGLGSYSLSKLLREEDLYFAISYSSLVLFLLSLLILVFPRILLSFKFFKKREYIFSKITFKNFLITNLFYLIAIVFYSLKIFLLFKIFRTSLSFETILAVSVLHLSIGLISILPGNLGIKEIGFIGVSSLFQIDGEIALGVMAMDRVFQVIFLCFGSYCYTWKKNKSLASILKSIHV